jgi:glucose/arabinose dehydrogenase
VDLLLIVEQRGRIRALDPRTGEVQREPVLDLADEVSCCGERGLLDVAPHPDVGENGWVFVSFTAPDGALTIDRYAWASDPGAGGDVRLDPATRRNVLAVPQPGEAHNGGSLAFGPDGMLYVGAGEGRYRLFPPRDARRLDTLLGSLLRIDVDALPYRVPPDNPFVDTDGARPEIWAYGLRNPWRFSIDAATNRLFLADVGQFDTEEINVVDLGTGGGYDFGWPVMEGPVCRVGCDDGPIGTLPPLSYGHDEGCSVIGGAVYRGAALPELTGSYLFGDFCRGTLWVADEASGDWRRRPLLATGAAISSIGVGADGEIYLADYGRGRVLRLVPATTP